MRILLCTLLVIFIIPSCRKPPEIVTCQCTTPGIVLQQQGFDATEWDTIITIVYEPDSPYRVASDTFITTDITNELLITPDIDSPKDFVIFLPSVKRVFTVTDIRIIARYEQAPKGRRPTCYNDISFNLDNQLISGLDTSTGRVYAQLTR